MFRWNFEKVTKKKRSYIYFFLLIYAKMDIDIFDVTRYDAFFEKM